MDILWDIAKIVGGFGLVAAMIVLRVWLLRDSVRPEWGNGKGFIRLFGTKGKSKDSN